MNRVGIVFSLIAILFFGTVSSTAMASVNQHANENSDRASNLIPDRYIVVLEEGFSSQQVAQSHGLSPSFIYKKALNGFAGTISPVALEKLIEDSRVKYVEQDQIVEIALHDPLEYPQVLPTGMNRIDLETNDIVKVDGVDDGLDAAVIAVIDTGVDRDHPDLNVDENNGFECEIILVFIQCYEGGAYGDDDNDHGTHVAGIAAALDNGFGVVGVAPGATIVPVKVLNADGSGSMSVVLAGIDYVTVRAAFIDVANLSLRTDYNQAFNDAVAASVSAGVVYVVAAGNDILDVSSVSPASEPTAITVSAIADFDGMGGGLNHQTVVFSICTEDKDDSFACFSNFGSGVDIAAPGVNILSTVRLESEDGPYAIYSGTSMAAPHVAGAAALVRSQDFGMTPEQVRSALLNMAIPQSSPSEGFTEDTDGSSEPLLNVGGTLTPNQIPVANAGDDQNVDENTTVNLSGSGTDSDGSIASYAWTQTVGTTVTLSDDTSASPSFTAPEVGSGGETLTFSLVVTDDDGSPSLADTVDINVADVSSPTDTVNVGDLEYEASSKKNWKGDVWITVHYQDDNKADGAEVHGEWFDESDTLIGSSTCTTGSTGIVGTCKVSKTSRGPSMTLKVTNIVMIGNNYDETMNDDIDFDSTGTEITIVKGGNSGDTGGEDPGNGSLTEAECQVIVDRYNQKITNGKKISNKLQSDYDECISLYPELAP